MVICILGGGLQLATALVVALEPNVVFSSEHAAFGDTQSEKIHGILIPSDYLDEDNIHGCHERRSPLPTAGPWIALVQRGDCNFDDKVLNMQKSGAVGVIVGDVKNGQLITMHAAGNDADISITSTFVTKDSYHYLKIMAIEALRKPSVEISMAKKFSNSKEVNSPDHQILSVDPAPTRGLLVVIVREESDSWSLTDILIIAILFPIVLSTFIYSMWRFRSSADSMETAESDVDPGVATEEDLAKLPTIKYGQNEHGDSFRDSETCAICLDDFKLDDLLRTLPCKHRFHVGCIDPWLLQRKKSCPVCKMDSVVQENVQQECAPSRPNRVAAGLRRFFCCRSNRNEPNVDDLERLLPASDSGSRSFNPLRNDMASERASFHLACGSPSRTISVVTSILENAQSEHQLLPDSTTIDVDSINCKNEADLHFQK